MKTDIEIAREASLKPVTELAEELGISADDLELYGKYKAKFSEAFLAAAEQRPSGKLILVTAVNPTPAGEGKTTTTVGLGDAMRKLGKKTVIALREPSLGPVFGIKGGAAGGGYAQVVPMEDINLHFTGDMHAITAANNLLAAILDNHLQQGNTLGIDPRRIVLPRCLDINDRALRNVTVGLGGKMNGVPREDHFCITVASEVMAILCLCRDAADLKARLGRILVAYTYDGKPVFASDLKAEGSMAVLLRDAIKPNLVQTLENTPCVMHGGPFANIAHGCNSVRATKLAMKLSDYCITEAGFGSDLGAEKFLDIKCRAAGIAPDAIVVVATVRALKYNGGVPKTELGTENLDALKKGICNLGAHVANMKSYGVPVVVAINRFFSDTEAELNAVADYCRSIGAGFALSEVFGKGGDGGLDLARAVIDACEQPAQFAPVYPLTDSIEDKITAVATKIYGAAGVTFTETAQKQLKEIRELAEGMPVCIAKTQYSLSDDPAKLGRPKDFTVTVREVKISNGAGFVVALAGSIMTMPGLPKVPAAESIDLLPDGTVEGLF